MRVLVDTNLFIAYLLKPRSESFIRILLDAVAEGIVTLLLPEALLDEIGDTIRRKPYLISRIHEDRLILFLQLLKTVGEEIPLISEKIPAITRDPNDDYLIAYAVVGQADYLISGDNDLLVLEKIGALNIVNSGQFRQILKGR
jgi:putative PIN family toxin of toxin-antitoxin system